MPASNDREHFETYRLQTRVKHQILRAYLPPYFDILKTRYRQLGFIDAFAGRGTYDDDTGGKVPGSPVQALEVIAERERLLDKVRTAFIEKDDELVVSLAQEVDAFCHDNPQVARPVILHGSFRERVDEALQHVGDQSPTFAFVDPCGVDGTSFDAIRRIMERPSCEAFVFFNIDGIRRTAGLDETSGVLEELLGSRDEAERLHLTFKTTVDDPTEREALILKTYQDRVKSAMEVQFFLPFGVESSGRRRTSHYLIHLTKSPLGFRIMKDVMWAHGRTAEGSGMLFQQASNEPDVNLLFKPQADAIQQTLLDYIGDATVNVGKTCDGLAERPEDYVAGKAYKDALKALETARRIEVVSKGNVVPAAKRPKLKGETTLADHYDVRKRSPEGGQ